MGAETVKRILHSLPMLLWKYSPKSRLVILLEKLRNRVFQQMQQIASKQRTKTTQCYYSRKMCYLACPKENSRNNSIHQIRKGVIIYYKQHNPLKNVKNKKAILSNKFCDLGEKNILIFSKWNFHI